MVYHIQAGHSTLLVVELIRWCRCFRLQASTLLLAFSSVKENEASGDRTLQNSAESCTRGNHACRILALLTHISAVLHGAEVSTPTIGAILATLAVINWTYFDRTVHGALLGVLLGVGAPLSEVVLNVLFGLWHYPREDLPGMVSWCGTHGLLHDIVVS